MALKTHCKNDHPLSGKNLLIRPSDGARICLTCKRKRGREWRGRQEWQAQWRNKVRDEALDHYGGKCACCGETERVFLTFDHIDDDGAEQRKADPGQNRGRIAYWLKKNGWPAGFQILCWNCNAAKHIKGVCPHMNAA